MSLLRLGYAKRSGKKHIRDMNVLAASIVGWSTGHPLPNLSEPQKDPPCGSPWQSSGKKRGKARFEKVTPEQRMEIAKRAARAR